MEKKIKIGEKILEILATAGVVGLTALCEGARDAGWVKSRNPEYRTKRSLESLARKDLVVKVKTSVGPKWQLTAAGKELFDKNNLAKIKLVQPAVWDGKWRVVIFDIPEHMRWARNSLRRKLKELDFTLIQKSVFCCPYPCKGEIIKTSEVLGVTSYVQFIEGDYLLNDNDLKTIYKLF
jgi:DNA-binding transcriptional regulator PaaX